MLDCTATSLQKHKEYSHPQPESDACAGGENWTNYQASCGPVAADLFRHRRKVGLIRHSQGAENQQEQQSVGDNETDRRANCATDEVATQMPPIRQMAKDQRSDQEQRQKTYNCRKD